ncbi:MAG TPA: MG2 domain-containing protein, partial [Puia sp.]
MGIKRVPAFFALCLLTIIVHAQPKLADYTTKWKLIDSLIQRKGLTQSALGEVNKLSVIARQEKNDPQLIKTLIYRLKLEQNRTDSGLLFAIKDLETELAQDINRQPARSILQCIDAVLHADYLRQNEYIIRQRSNTANLVKTDVATWTVEDLKEKIVTLFRTALADEEVLWQTPVEAYSPIILKGNTAGLRPTLFDLLAHTALDYFKNGENNQARLLFGRLVRRHQGDKSPDALIDVEIERIGFEHDFGEAANKEDHYLQALRQITDQYGNLPAAAEAWYLQARQYANQPGVAADQRDTLGNRKAVEICERVVAQPVKSEGRLHCDLLLRTLQQKELALSTERVNIPGKPFRALVHWRNFSRLYLRIIRVNRGSDLQENFYDSAFWVRLLQQPVVRAWSQDLPDTKDYTTHQAEIAVGSLPPGDYAVIGGTNADWSLKEATMCLQNLSVSRISWINQGEDYFVLNRETGEPLAGATVQAWERGSGGNLKQLSKQESYTTDDRGFFRLKKMDRPNYWSALLEVTVPGDHYFPTELVYRAYRSGKGTTLPEDPQGFEKRHARGFLFLDRSIYRPGQTVYFKGIEVTEDADSHKDKPMTGDSVKVFLMDANTQVVDSLVLTTNEFGSYHGAFRLPENRLNGNYAIRQADNGGRVNFSVEEYKRPKFYVDYDKLQGSYRVGDSIRVTGTAKGYAGNGIDGATVVYRVTRRANFRYSWMFWRRGIPYSFAEIQHGTLKTDGQGKFVLHFFALPDPQVSPDTKPEYNYE